MKSTLSIVIVFSAFLTTAFAQSGTGPGNNSVSFVGPAEVMAECIGTFQGEKVSLDAYLSSAVYCDSAQNAEYKGYIHMYGANLDGFISDAVISYRPGNYSATIPTFGVNTKLEVLLPKNISVPAVVNAKLRLLGEKNEVISSDDLKCSLPSYSVDCR